MDAQLCRTSGTGSNAASVAFVNPGTGGHPQSNAPQPLCVLRHCREHPRIATGPSGHRALLAHHAHQSELAGSGLVEAIPTDQGAVSISATKAVSPLLGVASYRRAVKHLLTSVVREICTLRSVGAGERATALGHPVGDQRWSFLPRPHRHSTGPHPLSNSVEHILHNRAHRIALERLHYAVVALLQCPALYANNSARKTTPTTLGWLQRLGDACNSTA